MPALPNVPQVIRVTLRWSVGLDTSVGTRVFFSYTGGAPTNASMATFATSMYNAANTQFVPLLHPGAALLECDAVDLTSPTAAQGAHAATNGGSALGGPLPASACSLVNLKIARRYRGGKPRVYFPTGTDANIANAQQWSTAYVNSMQTALLAWLNAAGPASPAPATINNQVSVSYYSGFESFQNPITGRWKNAAKPRATPIVDIVSTFVMNPKIGSQRRRIGA